MSLGLWLAVAALGGVGSVARMLGTLRLGGGSPRVGTLVVNLLGALALGVLSGADVDGDPLVLLGGALLGAFTTFSTWMHEVVGIWQDGRRRDAALLLAVALVAGLVAVAAGRGCGSVIG